MSIPLNSESTNRAQRTVAVAGGTGLVGSLVVAELQARGHRPIVLARSTGVDLTTGAGLDVALAGADVVIDVTNHSTTKRTLSVAFFEAVTGHLLAAEQRVGIDHHVALSIVGVDRVDLGYYAGKVAQEALVTSGTVPYSILRATHFHEFASQLLLGGTLVSVVPAMRSQPIAAREVATALVELSLGAPTGSTTDLAGPRPEWMPTLVRQQLRAQGSRRPVLTVRLPGSSGRALATDGLLPDGPGARGQQTFREWLDDEVAPS